MLKLVNITKNYYIKDQTPVTALTNVSINFRKNEFVSILGPSGCGKTTLLNIVGGLDKYTSGDLQIVGKSTKEFNDRDWDFYRNQRIGFIFQAYNLIPHQTVLENVELALTISGVSQKERKERALEALEKVGIAKKANKKPGQLSGGQCQRVAIARALVNNPEILLADEPTGALDTKTSVQIMDLIREIAKDRLVIMVTHNPDLANEYSTRIINLMDGEVVKDSNPYSDKDEEEEVNALSEEETNKKSKAKMSLLTSFKLSFRNLMSKLKRTLLVAIASSIGIIGVSAVLAVSFGVRNYIDQMQDDMLSSYPITIAEESVDYTSLIAGLSSWQAGEVTKFDITNQVGMDSMIDYLMNKYTDVTSVKTNNITETLIEYLSELESKNSVAAYGLGYGIDVTNNLFCKWQKSASTTPEYVSLNGLTQKYISELKTVQGFSDYAAYVDLFTNFMSEMPGDEEYILNQYDLLGNSKFATGEDEIMLVVDANQTLTDLRFAQLGYYTQDQFLNIARKVIKCNEAKKAWNAGEITEEEYKARCAQYEKDYPYTRAFDFEELIGSELYYFPEQTMYSYSKINTEISRSTTFVFVDMSGILYLTYEARNDTFSGINFSFASQAYEAVQLTRKSTLIPGATGLKMCEGEWVGTNQYFNTGTINVTTDPDTGTESATISAKYGKTSDTATTRNGKAEAKDVVTENIGYNYPAHAKDEWMNDLTTYGGKKVKVAGILKPKPTTKFGSLTRGVYYTSAFADMYMQDAQKTDNQILYDETRGILNAIQKTQDAKSEFKAFVTYPYTDFSTDGDVGVEKDDGYAICLNGTGGNSKLGSLFASLTGGSTYLEMDKSNLRCLSGLKTIDVTPEGVESKVYDFKSLPQSISIYPTNFDTKKSVTDYLDMWNKDVTLVIGGHEVTKDQRENITYTDTVSMIITTINLFIDIVTTALIIFTSLALVVSCFMIAIITIISVMERIKEIGVIRSLGGRKRDVSALFISENFMTGFFAGIIGIVITYVLSLIINVSVSIFGVPSIAALPWWMALVMILVSVLLCVVSGLIPSLGAAKKDPVVALRSE